jgi:SAM-dependent methyltransferase
MVDNSAYSNNISDFAKIYNSVSTPEVLPDFVQTILEYENRNDVSILDVGCGVGRDAFWLAEQGFKVWAIDSSPEMINNAKENLPHNNIVYLHDSAPDLNEIKALGKKFDVVLMSAFLFHLDTHERKQFLENLKSLVKENAYVFISLRYGPIPEGRVMYEVGLLELEDFANQNGFNYEFLRTEQDALGRKDVHWKYVSLISSSQPS